MGRPPVLLSPPLPPVKVTAGSPLPLPADKLSRSSWPEAGGTGWDGSTLHTQDPWVSCHKENRAFWGGLCRVWSLASLLHLLTLSPTLRDQLTFTPGEVLLSTGHHTQIKRQFGGLASVRAGVCLAPCLGTEPTCKAAARALGQPLSQHQGVGKGRFPYALRNSASGPLHSPGRSCKPGTCTSLCTSEPREQRGQKNPHLPIPRNHSAGCLQSVSNARPRTAPTGALNLWKWPRGHQRFWCGLCFFHSVNGVHSTPEGEHWHCLPVHRDLPFLSVLMKTCGVGGITR